MITVNNSFSLKLKELRQKNNLTQDQLADELNARYHLNESKATISQFEHNKRIPDLDRLINIADFFGVTLDDLACRKNIRKTESNANYPNLSFSTPQEALSFILKQDMVADFGGYDLDNMTDDEIMEMADDIADMLKIISRKHK